jgi:hypothetical protein
MSPRPCEQCWRADAAQALGLGQGALKPHFIGTITTIIIDHVHHHTIATIIMITAVIVTIV